MENLSSCKSCGEALSGNFCSNCGQKKYARIDRKYIMDEFQYSFLHMNKGFLYTIKSLIINPGKTARDYIEGNRAKHYKPILLAFVLATFSAFLSFKLIDMPKFTQNMGNAYVENGMFSGNTNRFFNIYQEIMHLFQSYNNFIMVLLIPIFALFSYIAFKSWKNNYYEHVVMNAFFQAIYTIVTIVILYPFYYLFSDNFTAIGIVSFIGLVAAAFLYVWFFKGFYPNKGWVEIGARVMLIYGLVFVLYIAVVVLGVIGGFVFGLIKG